MSALSDEQARWLESLERDRARTIDEAERVLRALRKNGRQATVSIKTTSRNERVMGADGPVDTRRFQDQADFYFEIPEGPA